MSYLNSSINNDDDNDNEPFITKMPQELEELEETKEPDPVFQSPHEKVAVASEEPEEPDPTFLHSPIPIIPTIPTAIVLADPPPSPPPTVTATFPTTRSRTRNELKPAKKSPQLSKEQEHKDSFLNYKYDYTSTEDRKKELKDRLERLKYSNGLKIGTYFVKLVVRYPSKMQFQTIGKFRISATDCLTRQFEDLHDQLNPTPSDPWHYYDHFDPLKPAFDPFLKKFPCLYLFEESKPFTPMFRFYGLDTTQFIFPPCENDKDFDHILTSLHTFLLWLKYIEKFEINKMIFKLSEMSSQPLTLEKCARHLPEYTKPKKNQPDDIDKDVHQLLYFLGLSLYENNAIYDLVLHLDTSNLFALDHFGTFTIPPAKKEASQLHPRGFLRKIKSFSIFENWFGTSTINGTLGETKKLSFTPKDEKGNKFLTECIESGKNMKNYIYNAILTNSTRKEILSNSSRLVTNAQ